MARGLLLRKGFLGEIKRADQRFSAEIRGLSNRLQQTAGKLYSRLCRVDLGSSECGVALGPRTDTYAVTQVIAADTVRIVTARATGFFTFGKATFTTGANAGAVNEVLLHDGQTIRLFVPMPRPIVVGDQIVLVAGCDKTPETCNAKFANILNFRGEPHIPGTTRCSPIRALMSPFTRAALLTEARTWIGTPWHHQAAVKGAGCDCIGFVRGVAEPFIGPSPSR